ncbi:MAG: ring-cleaving dioxygenase [Chloroflexi bacterium]|nr:MAG: ring-cleaving dioxygenase [Chloroflexota bacterium]
MQLNGLHHVTAVSGRIGRNVDFYTRVLGLRLVKKSVNQDDVSAYHLFYADKVGAPGTDMTFFDWPQIGREQRGTDSIIGTAFRVDGQAALDDWQARFDALNVVHHGLEQFAGRGLLRFEDPEGQRLMLLDDGGAAYEGEVWDGSDVPAAMALRGFYASLLSTPRLDHVAPILTRLLNYREVGRQPFPAFDGADAVIYETAAGGPGRQLWVVEQAGLRPARLGAGGVHHLALRVADAGEQIAWQKRIRDTGLPTSDVIDRYYFKSVYFRISPGILFEIATDGPGFATDEDPAHLGERLALPPFLEPRRAAIEAGLKPIAVTQ